MATSRNVNKEGESSSYDPQLDLTLSKMADLFDEQRNKWNENDRAGLEVSDVVALKRFQKFKPLIFNGEMGAEATEKWIEAMEKIYRVLKYSDERKVAFAVFQLEGLAEGWWIMIEEKW